MSETTDVGALCRCLNGLVAGAVTLWLATKGAHWHVSGPDFFEYHELFDSQADALYSAIDPLAERVRKLGQATLGGIAAITRNAPPVDCPLGMRSGQMVQTLLTANRSMERDIQTGLTLTRAANDRATENLLQELLDGTQKRIWFLSQTAQETGPLPAVEHRF